MLKPVINFVSRNLSNKSRLHCHHRLTNHLRIINNLSIRCMASEGDANSKTSGNVVPHLTSENEILKAKSTSNSDNANNNDDNEELDKIFDREFVDMKVEDFESLYNDDSTGTLKAQVETILKEYEYFKYNTMGCVPSVITTDEMERFFAEGLTPSSREKLFNYFFKREMAKRNSTSKRQREKAAKQAELAEKFAGMDEIYGEKRRTGLLSSSGKLIYGLWHNNLFCRIPENRLRLANSDSRLIDAAMFGRKLVFDFDFEQHMTTQTCRSVMEQVQDSYGINRFQYQDPFDIWFCNFNKESKGGQYMINNTIKNLYTGSMITVKNDCFTNYFDKSRLVYLSPNAKNTVKNIQDNDDIYIIGVYNDKGSVKPLTYRKAESLGIRAQSLPLDMYVAWQGGSKSLCLNHVIGILLEVMSNGGDWRSALLKCVPTRKLKPMEILLEEEAKRLARRKKFSIRNDFDF